jgi:hypothetical protein
MTRKPLVDALSSAAAPSLRAWVADHRTAVEGVVDAATAAPTRVVLAEENEPETPEEPLAFGDVEDLKDDGLTDEERKTALAWLRRRVNRFGGTFDAQEAHTALRLLPGWSSEVVPGNLVVSTDPPEPYAYTDKDREVLVPEAVARTYTVLPKGKKARDMPPGQYAEKVVPFPATVEPVSRAYAWVPRGWYDLPPGTVGYATGEQDEHGEPVVFALSRMFQPYVGSALFRLVKPATVTADPKRTALRVTDPLGNTATVEGAKAWDVLYAGGLQQDAEALVEALARRVQVREQMTKQEWGKHLCPVCFGYAAVTPSTNRMVDHRHRRPGWGYNVAPCEGNRFAPYKDAVDGTTWVLGNLERQYKTLVSGLRDTLAHPEREVYRVKAYVLDEKGKPVMEPDPTRTVFSLPPWERREGRVPMRKRVVEVEVRQGHPLFAEQYAEHVASYRASIRNIRNSIPFFRAAVRSWHAGADKAAPILAVMDRSDKPALPADLFPEGE